MKATHAIDSLSGQCGAGYVLGALSIQQIEAPTTTRDEMCCRVLITKSRHTTHPADDTLGESPLARWKAAMARARLSHPARCPRCGSANIVPSFTALEAWECWATGCMRPFCPND